MEREQREGGEEFDHRWMLGIEAEVVGLPAFVAGEDVIVFVPGEGLAVDGVDDLRGEDEEQREDRGGDPAVGANGWGRGSEGHREWGNDMSGKRAASQLMGWVVVRTGLGVRSCSKNVGLRPARRCTASALPESQRLSLPLLTSQ